MYYSIQYLFYFNYDHSKYSKSVFLYLNLFSEQNDEVKNVFLYFLLFALMLYF